jgi:hypothetical protein
LQGYRNMIGHGNGKAVPVYGRRDGIGPGQYRPQGSRPRPPLP